MLKTIDRVQIATRDAKGVAAVWRRRLGAKAAGQPGSRVDLAPPRHAQWNDVRNFQANARMAMVRTPGAG